MNFIRHYCLKFSNEINIYIIVDVCTYNVYFYDVRFRFLFCIQYTMPLYKDCIITLVVCVVVVVLISLSNVKL